MQRVGPSIIPLLPRKPDPAQTRLLQEFKYTSPLLACCFDPAGQFLYFSAQDNTIQRVELATGKITPVVSAKSWVRSLVCDYNPALHAGTYDGKAYCCWVAAKIDGPIFEHEAHRGWLRAVAVSPLDSLRATCGNDHLVKLWAPLSDILVDTLQGHNCHVYNVAFHPSGTALVSCDLKGIVKHWDVTKRPATVVRELDAKVLYKYDEGFRADIGGVRSIAFSKDGKYLACGGITDVSNAFAGVGKPAVVLFDWETGKRMHLLRPKEDFQGVCCGLAFHPDGYLIGTGGGNGGALWFWKPDQDKSFFTFKLPTNARDLALHPDGFRLGVACFDNTARVYTMMGKV